VASEGIQSNVPDRSSAEMGHPSSANKHVHNPRNFYASELPVINKSNSDHEFYESAKDFGQILKPGDQVSGQVGGQDISMPGSHAVC